MLFRSGATAAPALGSPTGVKLSLPTPPAPAPEPAQEVPLEAVPAPAPVPAKPAPSRTAMTADKIPNFNRSLQRTESRVAARLEAKYKKQLEAERRRLMTEEEFRKEHGSARTAQGISGGVVGGSVDNKTGGAGGKALTREEGQLLEGYFALLRSRLTENLEKPTDVSDALTAKVEFYVAADGSISRVRIIRSSGNPEFDKAVLEAFRRTPSIGPRPDGHGDAVQLEFRMREDDSAG